jgi:hypothetical protein
VGEAGVGLGEVEIAGEPELRLVAEREPLALAVERQREARQEVGGDELAGRGAVSREGAGRRLGPAARLEVDGGAVDGRTPPRGAR